MSPIFPTAVYSQCFLTSAVCALLLGRERVMAGVDCGFSVHAGSGNLDPEVVWAKLAALAEGAAIASRRY